MRIIITRQDPDFDLAKGPSSIGFDSAIFFHRVEFFQKNYKQNVIIYLGGEFENSRYFEREDLNEF